MSPEYVVTANTVVLLFNGVCRPPYLAIGWVQAFNPEGTPYYVNESKNLVTDDPIYQSDISSRITRWAEKLDILIENDDLVLPDDYEIFITVAAEDDGCKYYFVDHTTRTVFWLEEIDPERHGLELAQVCSIAHMRTFRPRGYNRVWRIS